MKVQIRSAVTLFVLLTILTGAAYPIVVTLAARGLFSYQANGSVIESQGKLVGSELIGQQFNDPKYFWGRPSATGPFPYNAASSAGSNLGLTNPVLLDAIRDRVKSIREVHPDQSGPVPVELVTASGSGLDPHISPAAAEYQMTRVAKARGMNVVEVRLLVERQTERRTFGLLGEPRINVLRLNLALDRATKR